MASDAQQRQTAEREKNVAALSSVVAAIFLTSMKIVVGLLTGSLGILSEAAHSGLDLVAAAVTFFAVRLSGKPADLVHTYGHGKVENISALFETLLLLLTCVWIIYEAILRLFFKSVVVEASVWAFVVMGISIFIDYSRSRLLQKVAKKYDSQALEADALHFSTDIWSSSVVIIGLFLVLISEWLNIPWLDKADAVAALGVALIVIYVSVQLGRKTIADLLDSIPPGKREELIKAVQVQGVQEVKRLRVRRSGPETFADVTVKIAHDTPLEVSDEIANRVVEAMQVVMPGADVVVSTEAGASKDQSTLTAIHRLAARFGLRVHKVRIYNNNQHGRTLEMHVEVDEDLNLEQANLKVEEFEQALHQSLSDITDVATHIEPSGDRTATRQATPADETEVRSVLENIQTPDGLPIDFYDLRVHRVGKKLSVSFTIVMPPGVNIAEAHVLTEQVEQTLKEKLPIIFRVVIHEEPSLDT